MYLSYWGLRDAPFRGGPSPGHLHESTNFGEALARMQFLADQQRRLGLLLGEAGVGKSLLMGVFAERQQADGAQIASLSLLGVGAAEFAWLAADRLGVQTIREATAHALWRALADHLAELRYQRLPAVLLVDDADEARHDVLEQLVRLIQLDQSPGARLTTVVAANPGRLGRLGSRLLELAELRIDLEPWDELDVATYVRQALAAAGGRVDTFSPAALVKLHELTAGAARRVQQLADLTLLAGAGRELAQIDAETVDSVSGELSVVTEP